MNEGPARDAAARDLEELRQPHERVFVGRSSEGIAAVALADGKGRQRIRMYVGSDGAGRLEFLDEAGEVVYRFPPEPASA
ncbi:MAG: hypothetical protein HY775_00700 [Acidobacteria bacterium]|nr:hypothetical protein [Acidobacteriota bacterium]